MLKVCVDEAGHPFFVSVTFTTLPTIPASAVSWLVFAPETKVISPLTTVHKYVLPVAVLSGEAVNIKPALLGHVCAVALIVGATTIVFVTITVSLSNKPLVVFVTVQTTYTVSPVNVKVPVGLVAGFAVPMDCGHEIYQSKHY